MSGESGRGEVASLTELEVIVRACDRFEAAWRGRLGPRIEDHLDGTPPGRRGALLRELVALEVELRRAAGEAPGPSEYRRRFPGDAALIEALLAPTETRPGPAGSPRRSPLFPQRVGDRFEVFEVLGRGGMGVVYRAYDRLRGGFVAIKTLPSPDPALLYRLKREFRALTDVTHPNLVGLHDLSSDGGTWFISMELIDGVDLLAHVGGRATGGTPAASTSPGDDRRARIARLRGALAQLARGVSALHSAGILHRDIKPSNVLVTGQGRVVLLDFGLAAGLGEAGAHRSSEHHVLGTAAYMAPEQAAGLAVGPSGDWYSVGVVLYQALTGRLPFGGTTLEILLQKQKSDPPPPADPEGDLPGDLAGLSLDLLRRDPAARPAGPEVLRRLGDPAPPGGPAAPGGPTAGPIVPLVGRDGHLEALEAALAASRGRATVCLLRGPSGIGKSALAGRFLGRLRARGAATVFEGRCYEREAVPYKALDMCVDSLGRYLARLPAGEALALLPRDVPLLAQIFPVLQLSEAVATAPRRAFEIPDPLELRRRAFAALRELLARIGDRGSLVLAVDDLQWGDLDSATALTDLLRPPDAPPMLLLGCHRAEDADGSPFLRALPEWRKQVEGSGGWREVAVGALSPAEASGLARDLLSREGRAAGDQADAIARESEGNPFFIAELARHCTPGPGDVGDPIGGSGVRLEAMIRSRVRRLPEAARRLLEVVAVSGRPLRLDLARLAAGIGPEDEATPVLLRTGRFLRGTGDGPDREVETYHDRVREAVVGHLPAEGLRGHHRSLALALEASDRADDEVLAAHHLGAGEAARAGEFYERAADRSSGALAFDRAARLYELALSLRSIGGDVGRSLRTRLADALVNAGRGGDAAREYLLAARGAPRAEALELERRAALQLLFSGRIDQGVAVLRKVLGSVGMRVPRSPAGALASLAFHRAWLRIRGLGFRRREAAAVDPRELERIDAAWTGAIGLSFSDRVQGLDFMTRSLLLALRAGEPTRIALALALEAGSGVTNGSKDRSRAARLLGVANALARSVDRPYLDGFVAASSGIVAYVEGRWQDAAEASDRAEVIFRERCTGVAWELDTILIYSLLSLAHMGRLAELGRRLPALLAEAGERGDLYATASLSTYLTTLVRLAEDDPAAAVRESRVAMGRWSQGGFHLQHHFAVLGESYASLYQGVGRSTWEDLSRLWRPYGKSLLTRLQNVRVHLFTLRALAALAAAAAGLPSRPAYLRVAAGEARRLESERVDRATALARSIQAALAVARGDRASASGLLFEAAAGFDGARMGLHAEAVRHRLGGLVGGASGRALAGRAAAWMEGQGIRRPDRMAAMLLPGDWPSA